MDFITLTQENLDSEHICCAISNNRDCQVAAKKAWLRERLDEGLKFIKADARGKCFIEYIPAERAWAPVDAPGCGWIDCLWVSGQFQGHGYADQLMDRCVDDCKERGMTGLAILSSKKKRPFLADPGYLKHRGFAPVDEAQPFFELWYLPLDEGAPAPRFRPQVKALPPQAPGFALYYTHQCPYTAKYVPLLEALAREKGVTFRAARFERAEQAQAGPSPYAAFSLYRDGTYVTHEIPSEKRFLAMLEEYTADHQSK